MTSKNHTHTNFKATIVEVTYTLNGNGPHTGHYTISAETLNHSAHILNTTDFNKALEYAVYFIFIGEEDEGEIININIK